eukprot:CAMPEP_0170058202 /NCGR_PEP_ID=MMETSP0019_2-20121128/915_1 /TAXON_ID=98059 /ORGANISM="Dinobryon sp., Strain UTEXLB2267" /LENGTH=179 /DNA_ID=CAMNT_0010263087 /DNA_START=3 /DNA_END=543 /DNA_ORIENTATION=+
MAFLTPLLSHEKFTRKSSCSTKEYSREKLLRDAVVQKCMKQFNLKRSMNILRYRNGNAMTNKALVSNIVSEALNKMDDSNASTIGMNESCSDKSHLISLKESISKDSYADIMLDLEAAILNELRFEHEEPVDEMDEFNDDVLDAFNNFNLGEEIVIVLCAEIHTYKWKQRQQGVPAAPV